MNTILQRRAAEAGNKTQKKARTFSDSAQMSARVIRDGCGPPVGPAMSTMPPKAEINSEH
jgi:hypothetical protein